MRRDDTHRTGVGTPLAVIALVLALSATALALPGRNSVNSGDIKTGAVKRADQQVNQRTDWALIDLDEGEIVASSPGAELVSTSAIAAQVDFGHSIKNRPLVATTQWPGTTHAEAFHCGTSADALSCKTNNNDRTAVINGGIGESVYLAVLPK